MRMVPIKAFLIIYIEKVKETVISSCISLGIVKAAGLSCGVSSRREVRGESEGRRLVDCWGFHTVGREVDNISFFLQCGCDFAAGHILEHYRDSLSCRREVLTFYHT